MSDSDINEPTGWWSKQSGGAKIAIGIAGVCCLGILILVVSAGLFAPDASTDSLSTADSTNTSSSSSSSTPAASGESYVEVSYDGGSWDGSITIQNGNNEEEINFDGSGTKKFDISKYADSDIYVNAQKNNDGSGKLSAKIVKNGETKLSQSTTEGYGIVNGWVFSYE
jgi:hypothetical protein